MLRSKSVLWRTFFLSWSVGVMVIGPGLYPVTAETRVFRMHSREEFLQGTLEGIAVDGLGTLRLADQVERLAEVDEPFLLSATTHPDGWIVGTGNAGKVLSISRQGEVRVLFATDEPEVFAVWADPDGTLFVGSSPNGKVYRLANDTVDVFFSPGETYIWGLARAANGRLLVATGTEGRLFEVDDRGRGQVLFDSEDTHLRSMKVLPSGEVLLGTAGEGLILKLSPEGQPRTLYDAPHPEVVAFAADPEGDCYAAVLASEASRVSLDRQVTQEPTESTAGEDESDDQGQATVTVSTDGSGMTVGSRPAGFAGPRSEILRISGAGAIETLTTFEEETVYSLLWFGERLWIGTGVEGKIFSLEDHAPVLENEVDERQVVALLGSSGGMAFATTNAAAIYRVVGQQARQGIYTSPVLDAGQIARFGILRWIGEQPGESGLAFSFRSGMSAEPDKTWTAWSPYRSGEQISLESLPSGRYLQWRTRAAAVAGAEPSLSEVTLSYRQANLAPRIKKLEVLDPGQILVPANFNPAQQVFEPAHPNREGIFTSLESTDTDENRRLKTLWKKGYLSLRWEADDPNGDTLKYSLAFRQEDGSGPWLSVVENIEEDYFGFDATALPDGRYRFRLSVVDRDQLDDPEIRISEEVSGSVLNDHSPAVLESIQKRGTALELVVEDRWNPLRSVETSVDAKEWRPVRPTDGLLDGQRETLLIEATGRESLLLLRVVDAAFNVMTYDLSGEIEP